VKAEWATALTVKGDKLTTIEVGDLIVDVYQVGTAKSDTGDELVVVNYVVTNVSSTPVPLDDFLVTVSVPEGAYDTMDGESVLEGMGLNHIHNASDYNHDSPYILEPGQAFSYADVLLRPEGNAVTFGASYIPATADGELDFDNEVEEVEAKATLK
ncbi:MAG: hypothetical protein LBU50_06050, partial [Cellulomonas sp.]|nr:hypothetical protein [Cellulomonas sp.]